MGRLPTLRANLLACGQGVVVSRFFGRQPLCQCNHPVRMLRRQVRRFIWVCVKIIEFAYDLVLAAVDNQLPAATSDCRRSTS
ncbi:hypothetical protein RZS08_38640, partial [Arthrospira platensis SPKY1]|nr:hypothetical protein [Arthrospira platensis SPKY1]